MMSSEEHFFAAEIFANLQRSQKHRQRLYLERARKFWCHYKWSCSADLFEWKSFELWSWAQKSIFPQLQFLQKCKCVKNIGCVYKWHALRNPDVIESAHFLYIFQWGVSELYLISSEKHVSAAASFGKALKKHWQRLYLDCVGKFCCHWKWLCSLKLCRSWSLNQCMHRFGISQTIQTSRHFFKDEMFFQISKIKKSLFS